MEGRDLSVDFDTDDYPAGNPGAKALQDPPIHFLEIGIQQERSVQADGVWG
jgi:hypothetical protein